MGSIYPYANVIKGMEILTAKNDLYKEGEASELQKKKKK